MRRRGSSSIVKNRYVRVGTQTFSSTPVSGSVHMKYWFEIDFGHAKLSSVSIAATLSLQRVGSGFEVDSEFLTGISCFMRDVSFAVMIEYPGCTTPPSLLSITNPSIIHSVNLNITPI